MSSIRGAHAVIAALDRLSQREGATALPGYTHMQQAMPSSVSLWAGGYAAELSDDARGIKSVHRRIEKNPLGSAAGFGTPGLPLDRDATTRALGFDITQQPVTSVQLSRGKAEAQLLFELALLMQDLGRMAADLLLFYTQEFAFIELPDAFTTGSSIMPQKRNPDLFELVRGRSATALACLTEALSICAKLPSGYQRDLQLLKFPLFRGIDISIADARHHGGGTRRAKIPPRPHPPRPVGACRPKKPLHWWSKKAYPFARPISGWRRATCARTDRNEQLDRAPPPLHRTPPIQGCAAWSNTPTGCMGCIRYR